MVSGGVLTSTAHDREKTSWVLVINTIKALWWCVYVCVHDSFRTFVPICIIFEVFREIIFFFVLIMWCLLYNSSGN